MCRIPKSSSHQIASTTLSRTSNQARRSLFSALDDRILLRFVKQLGTQQWQRVAQEVTEASAYNYTARQCKERWDILWPNLEAPWTEDEKKKVCELVEKHGKKWHFIGRIMNRSPISCQHAYKIYHLSYIRTFKGPPIQNKEDGLRREAEVLEILECVYPSDQGYIILSEVYLRDQNGNKAIDTVTNTARRIDFVVVHNNQVVRSIEVTSMTADKTKQLAKENRIRQNGGHYIRCNGQLISIKDVETTVEKRD